MTGISPQADESGWPLLPQERTWGAARLTLTLATTAAATWCYLIGESVGSYLGFIKGGLALGAGCYELRRNTGPCT
jgi:NCS1 family nucleobase:cation symporter-1